MPRSPVRPLEPRDIDAVHHVTVAAFEDLARRFNEPPEPAGPIAASRVRIGRLLATDPGGAWVAERGGEVVGCSLALVRDGVWGLSLLVVAPGLQSSGLGRELLARAWEHGAGARGWIVLASRDPRALRSYSRLGLHLLAARDRDGAAVLLRASLAAAGGREAHVEWITSAQDWAIGPCLDAGLELRMDVGAVFLGGDVGPFAPYLPSGAYL